MHRYWSLYSESDPTANPATDARRHKSKRKSVLSNYSLPDGSKKKARIDAQGQGGESAAEKAADASTTAGGGGAAAAGAEGGDAEAEAAGSRLPTPALPYSELYAIFGDKLQPFLPTAAAGAVQPGAAIADVPAL